jgi:hypothetical protein
VNLVHSRCRYRPQFDVLEDRALPNSLLSLQEAFSHSGGPALGELSSLISAAGSQDAPPPSATVSDPQPKENAPGNGPQTAVGQTTASTQTQAAVTPSTNQAAPLTARGTETDQTPGVLPVQSHAYGASYGEWSARWWQYALSIPAPQSPFFDQTGADFAVGQSGKVWYLSGGIEFTPNGQPPAGNLNVLDRSVTLSTGKALFFPVLNSETDNVVPGGTNTNYTADQLRAFAKQQQDSAENMFAQIDGRSVLNVSQYRVTSPVFSYTLPDNNIEGVPAQVVYPAVGDGVYLMVAPLSPGQHTIRFGGDFGPGNFALDITYHITVTPGN